MKIVQSKTVQILGIALCAALAVMGCYFAVAWGMSLRDPQKLASFQEYIASLGIKGWVLLLVIQYVQIVVAFIPGGPVQIVAGALFGPVGGLATCLLGMLLATATVFALVNRFGPRIISLFVKEGDIKKYKFLEDAHRLEFLVVLLFLIPGTLKDVLTYLFALTPIKLSRFLLLSTVARIPAALTSVLMGNSVVGGKWLQAVIYFAVITAISLGGLLLHRRIMAKYSYRRHRP